MSTDTPDDDDEISIAEFERLLDAELRRLFPDLFDSTEPALTC